MSILPVLLLLSTLALTSIAAETQPPPLLTYENGKIGVNFLGFGASAGLDGGPHAEAKTPWGQAAGAGVGGTVGPDGRAAGGLYAGATAGGNIQARAGLGGSTGPYGSYGGTYAGASAGNAGSYISKVAVGPRQTETVEVKQQAPIYIQKELVEKVPQTVVVERTRYRKPLRNRVKIYNTEWNEGAEPAKVGTSGTAFTGSATVAKTANPDLFNDIFNIPISTLRAVATLLNGIAGSTSGTVQVAKSYY